MAAWRCSPGGSEALVTVNAGARLDRLPISSFHRRILLLIGIGMFFDGFDVYVAATILGADRIGQHVAREGLDEPPRPGNEFVRGERVLPVRTQEFARARRFFRVDFVLTDNAVMDEKRRNH